MCAESAGLSLAVELAYENFSMRVDETVALAGVTGVFGPSGSGKTSLLRIIAGFEKRAQGRVAYGNQVWQDSDSRAFVAAYRRPVGMVFQDARLFPHLSVAGNLDFARRRALQDSATDYEDVLAAFDLGPLLPRDVLSLSGGERQRVAIARTLLAGPGLLLLDEPLAALDAARKNEILPYLETLAIHFSVPVLYVSHAIDEIVRLADQVLVLDGGRVREIGDASIVLNKLDVQSPSSAFEAVSVLDGTIVEQMQDSGLTRIGLGTQSMVVPELAGHGRGTRQRLFVRAGDVAIALQRPEQISVRNVLQGQVREIVDRPDGPFAIVVLDVDGQALRAELTRHAIADLDLRPGLPVYVLLKTATFDRRN